MSTIWTDNVLRQFYRGLVRRYGLHRDWPVGPRGGRALSPGRGFDENYRQFLDRFARDHGASSGRAVRLKLYHVVFPRREGNVKWAEEEGLRCIAAAVKAGFISEPPIS